MIDLDAIKKRDAESAGLWFIGPASFTAQAARDRRELLACIEVREAAARAAIAYDEAIASCGNDPAKMSSFCSAEGEDLDALYASWITKAREALK